MTPNPRRTVPRGTAVARWLLVIGVALVVAACGPSIETVSFDPATTCATQADEGRFPGAFPELEALLPASYDGAPPSFRDSGRSCTPENLGTLAERGIREIHFAGANWDLGNGQALTIAVFEARDLDATRMIEFYEAGARAARRTNDLQTSDTTIGTLPARRLDVLFGDSRQTIVAWPEDPSTGRVKVLLTSELGDAKVSDLLDRIAAGRF